MKRISSRSTFFTKKVFPVFWFGFWAFFLVLATSMGVSGSARFYTIAAPIALSVFGFFLMKRFVWDLADEVYDCGDSLLVKNRGEEERIPLSNIMNVSASTLTNPPRITLRLVSPGRFGNEVSFCPITKFTLNPFAKDQVSDDLILRVDQARSQRRV